MPLPRVPGHERHRREAWLKVPRRARAAIRRMHREWGHMNKTVLRKILKTAKAPQEYLDAVDSHLCNDCELTAPKAQTTKVGPPRPYEFNHTVGVDFFDLHDLDGQAHLFLNIVDMGTNFQSSRTSVWGREYLLRSFALRHSCTLGSRGPAGRRILRLTADYTTADTSPECLVHTEFARAISGWNHPNSWAGLSATVKSGKP